MVNNYPIPSSIETVVAKSIDSSFLVPEYTDVSISSGLIIAGSPYAPFGDTNNLSRGASRSSEPYHIPTYKNPYIVQCQNRTDEVRTIILFGNIEYYMNRRSHEFDDGVTISGAMGSMSYEQMLSRIDVRPLRILRIKYHVSHPQQMHQGIQIHEVDMHGRTAIMPLSVSGSRNRHSDDSCIVEMPVDFTLSGTAHIEIQLLPRVIIALHLWLHND